MRRERFIAVEPGVQLYCRILGDGPSVVVIPNANWLPDAFEPLAEGRTLIFYDPRGRGRSSAVTDPSRLGLDLDAQDLEAVRRHLGLDGFALLAHSYNAYVAALYAAEHPETVRQLVLVCPLTPRRPREWDHSMLNAEALRNPPGVERLEEMRRSGLDKSDPVAFCHAWLKEFLLPAQMADPSAVARMPIADIASFPNEWPDNIMALYFDHLFAQMGDWDFGPKMRALTVPLLVIHGAEDLIPLSASQEWVAMAPDARILTFSDCGNHPYVEIPDPFFAAVDRFLQGHWPEDAVPVGLEVAQGTSSLGQDNVH